MFYIPTKYEENWRTLLIFRPIHPSIHSIPSIHPSVNSALRASRVDLPWTPKGHCRCLLPPSPIFKRIGRFAPSLRALHARHDFNENPSFWKVRSHRALRARGLVKSLLKSLINTMYVSRVRYRMFLILNYKKGFWDFRKTDEFN